MVFPLLWMIKGPGFLLPVFFLSLFLGRLNGQIAGQEASVSALGGAFVSRSGYSCAIQNQAGLAWVDDHSVSLNHSRPYLELGISSIGLQVNTEKGALGTFFSSYGIPGLRQSSFWVSYGMTLTSVLSVGLGMHFWTYSLPEKMIHHPGISLALGLQARINDQWILGVHVLHPRVWENTVNDLSSLAMTISVGCSYSFFKTATVYSELHMAPGKRIQWASGIQWTIRRAIGFMLGIHNQPFTWSAGLTLVHKRCEMQIAFQYVTDTGTIPSTSIHYAW
jgi:hypothetical protein